jgi:FtsP/CotA-like multicopper oxidase with cupredoxin domain
VRLGVAFGLVATVGGCAGDGPARSAATTGAPPTAAPTTTAGATTTRAPTTTGPQATVIRVRVGGGEVQTASDRVRVRRGQRVRLEVVADVADEVHVHGYDLKRDAGPGRTAVLEFTADRPGVFEVELEAARRRLLQLEVR